MLNREIYLVEVEGSGAPRVFWEYEEDAMQEAKRLYENYKKRVFIFKAIKVVDYKLTPVVKEM